MTSGRHCSVTKPEWPLSEPSSRSGVESNPRGCDPRSINSGWQRGYRVKAQKNTFGAYEDLLGRIVADGITHWSTIEDDFLIATGEFDAEYARGGRDPGWYKSKARYFNDFIVALLSNASDKPITTRTKKKSRLYSFLDIDVCYPKDGVPIIGAEVKLLGTPPHPGNGMKPRPARTDLHKRSREVAFTAIDFKAAYAAAKRINSFQHWIDTSNPGYFAIWAMRVNDESDFNAVRTILVSLRHYCNGVGAVIYEPASPSEPTTYRPRPVKELDIDWNILEMAQRIA